MVRRVAMVVATMIPLIAGCSSEGASDESCGPLPAAGVTSAEEWLGRIHESPDDISVAVDDGQGHSIERRADDQQPIASAVKVVSLAAYARAVAAGTLDPQQQVPVDEWERWYLPGTDGGAHPAARARLTGETVTLDQMVSAMIRESDNAVPDYLRDRLGDHALIAAAEAGGWRDYTPSTQLGQMIRLLDSDTGDDWALARRYAVDDAYRATIGSKTMPPFDRQMAWTETTATASAHQLASMHRAIASGSFGPGTDVARAHLEWQQPPAGFAAIGFKGGSYPGVLSDAIYLRRADGTVATAVLLNRRMPEATWASAVTTLREQEVLVRAMTEPAMWRRLACAT
ncbi:serine hydrolase [Nocardia cyriacigeorgica]|uniref:serine hydrolase n=1 Tax=Nocardia cyriacigeorgica TaxID=135487 RepID=UPI002454BE6E|nr:serine hydrolase [Nocardia cyriacigeorgica]